MQLKLTILTNLTMMKIDEKDRTQTHEIENNWNVNKFDH